MNGNTQKFLLLAEESSYLQLSSDVSGLDVHRHVKDTWIIVCSIGPNFPLFLTWNREIPKVYFRFRISGCQIWEYSIIHIMCKPLICVIVFAGTNRQSHSVPVVEILPL